MHLFRSAITIGFCDKQFPLENNWLGNSNSIGIWRKYVISIDGFQTKLEDYFKYFAEKDVIGLGIIYQPDSIMECFSTFNGELLGKIF